MTLEGMPPTDLKENAPTRSAPRLRDGLRWFVSEFLVVVAGVLVALAVSAWWQGRQDRAHERQYLQQLDADLLATENEMQIAKAQLIARAVAAAAVQHAYWGERPANDLELRENLLTPWRTARFRPLLGNIDALVSTGDMSVIRSAPLRTALVSYLEWSRARLDDINRYDETYYRSGVNDLQSQIDISTLLTDTVRTANDGRPHAFDMSTIAATGTPPFPVDLDAVFKNQIIYNAYSKIMLAHRNQASQYGLMLARARSLHAQVYRQLHGVDEPGNCQLTLEDDARTYAGSCGALSVEGSKVSGGLKLSLNELVAITSGRWKSDDLPASVWTGKWVEADGTQSDIELEVSLVGDGILRTQWGWFATRAAGTSDDRSDLSFRIDTGRSVPANTLDIAILDKAKFLLSDPSHWDRHDDRKCSPDKPSLSLYCALTEAMRLQSGGVHHRRPAMQLVRVLVDARSVGRDYAHRLRDYNNDPRTTLADLHQLLDEAIVKAHSETPAQ